MVFNGLGSPHLDQDCATEAAPPPYPLPAAPGSLRAPEEGPGCAPPLPSDTSWPWGLSPRPHPPPLLLLPGERLEAGEPGAAPLCGYLDPKRNGAFLPRREVCEPFPLRSPLGYVRKGTDPPQARAARGFGGVRLTLCVCRARGGAGSCAWSQRDRCRRAPLPKQQLWPAGSSGAPRGAGLSRRAFLVLEEAEEAGRAATRSRRASGTARSAPGAAPFPAALP